MNIIDSLFLISGCDEVCFSKAFEAFAVMQRWSLWQNLFISPCSCNLFLVNSQVFTINSSDEVCDKAVFYLHDITKSIFSKGFTIICCCAGLIKLTHMESVAMNFKRTICCYWNIHAQNVILIYVGKSKAVKFKT